MTINRFVSDESIVIEDEMKKVKVLDYHFHSDSSRNLPQFKSDTDRHKTKALSKLPIGRNKCEIEKI